MARSASWIDRPGRSCRVALRAAICVVALASLLASNGKLLAQYAPPVVTPGPAPLPGAVPPAPVPVAPAPAVAPIPAPADGGLLLSPGVIVAPLNANVILVAGVYGAGRQMLPNQPVQWTVVPGSVGQIHAVGQGPRGLFDFLGAPVTSTAAFAQNETFSSNEIIRRGTASPADALTVLRGQTWISVTSAIEGNMSVTALAPAIASLATRQQTAVVHWVDARWVAPLPAAGPAGARRTLTTTVMRQSNRAPLAGWHVKYEIVGGPSAGFGADLARSVEVAANDQGQASVEIGQSQPMQGTNQISVQLIHPAARARSSSSSAAA